MGGRSKGEYPPQLDGRNVKKKAERKAPGTRIFSKDNRYVSGERTTGWRMKRILLSITGAGRHDIGPGVRNLDELEIGIFGIKVQDSGFLD